MIRTILGTALLLACSAQTAAALELTYTQYFGGCSPENEVGGGTIVSITPTEAGFCYEELDESGASVYLTFAVVCGEEGIQTVYSVCEDSACGVCSDPVLTIDSGYEGWVDGSDGTGCYEETYADPTTGESVSLQVAFEGDVLEYFSTIYQNSCISDVFESVEDTDDSIPTDDAGPEGCLTILETVCASEDHQSLCKILSLGGDVTLEESITLFAPTDAGIAEFESFGLEITDEDMSEIIQFHATAGIVTSGDLICKETIEMLNGADTRTKCVTDDATGMENKHQKGGGNNRVNTLPQIIAADIEACDGIVHVLDGVLVPNSIGLSLEE